MKARTRVDPGRQEGTTAYEACLQVLADTPRWLVCPHQAPDADSLGSSLALARLIEAMGGEAHVVSPEKLDRFDYMPDVARVQAEPPEGWDGGMVALDAADVSRLGSLASLATAAHPRLNIDHHVSNTHWGTHNLVDLTAAATGEIVHTLFSLRAVPLDAVTAPCLYAALLTDTGGFRYPSTTARTMAVAADLLASGIDAPGLAAAIYERRSVAAVRLTGEATAGMRLSPDGRLAWSLVTAAMFSRTGASEDEADGIVERLREVAGVELLFVARDSRDGGIRVSLRSKGRVDVNALAAGFGGGGHRQASGFTATGSLEELEARLVAACTAALNLEACP